MLASPLDIWHRLGGAGEPPRLLGTRQGSLLILGGGRQVWDDYGQVRPSWTGTVAAVNDVGQHLHDRLAHWMTLHPEYLPGWRAYRCGHCYGEGVPPQCHAPRSGPGVDCVWPLGQAGETSGLFACFVGLMLGYERILLAGIPATDEVHYFDPPWQRGSGYDAAITFGVWTWARDHVFAGRVRSLSGKTRDWLGEP